MSFFKYQKLKAKICMHWKASTRSGQRLNSFPIYALSDQAIVVGPEEAWLQAYVPGSKLGLYLKVMGDWKKYHLVLKGAPQLLDTGNANKANGSRQAYVIAFETQCKNSELLKRDLQLAYGA